MDRTASCWGIELNERERDTHHDRTDRLGSTRAMVDGSGNVVKSYQYDVYGEVTGGSGSQGNEFDFAGRQTDATGLQYLRARYYDPATGVFLSRDPLAVAAAWTGASHGYANASPAVFVDPTGLWSIWPGGGGTCLFGIGICKDGDSSPPGVDAACVGWYAYTVPPHCKAQIDRLNRWLDDHLVEIGTLVGEYLAVAPYGDGPKKLTGFTRHGINQAISRDGHGVSTRAIREAIKHGQVTKEVRGGRPAWVYRGRDATVVLNAAGRVITVIATSRRGWRY
ncbi:MAG: RHS repeat-associated core domain-containing protein [Fimbriimonadia bacterium]